MSTHERRRHAKQPADPVTRRHDPAAEVEAPVVLPLLVVTVTETGALDVTLDGTDFPPPEDAGAWTRRSFGRLLDAATREREISLRVEVRETDGTSFTDLIPARPRRTPPPTPEPAEESQPVASGLVEVTAGGFVAGEDVDACLVIAHTDATHAGAARVVIDPATVPEHGGMVLLVGRVSGHVHAEGLS
ncbi:hypothetical protein [Brachybacterium tyrofermentans]|uniref:hypothetical protein n=1 Tax=Brachybacterium tyrofermentans TaxID=47848 RepID=UPI003FD23D7B